MRSEWWSDIRTGIRTGTRTSNRSTAWITTRSTQRRPDCAFDRLPLCKCRKRQRFSVAGIHFVSHVDDYPDSVTDDLADHYRVRISVRMSVRISVRVSGRILSRILSRRLLRDVFRIAFQTVFQIPLRMVLQMVFQPQLSTKLDYEALPLAHPLFLSILVQLQSDPEDSDLVDNEGRAHLSCSMFEGELHAFPRRLSSGVSRQ